MRTRVYARVRESFHSASLRGLETEQNYKALRKNYKALRKNYKALSFFYKALIFF